MVLSSGAVCDVHGGVPPTRRAVHMFSACCLRRRWGAADAHDSLGGCGPAKGEPCRSFEHFLGCPHAAAPRQLPAR